MGGEKKPLVMSELGCADGCGGHMGAENCADGCGRRGCKGVAGNGWGEEAAGDERPWLRGRLRTANGCGELRGWLRTARVQRRWLEMDGEKKPLVVSERGCADGCGRQMGSENCVDGCGRRGCNGVAGNGWGEGKGRERMGKEATGRERKGQEGKGRERMGKEGKGKGKEGKGRERKGKEGKGRERKGKDGKGRERKGKDAKGTEKEGKAAADGVGARGWLEMGGEKKPLVMSDLGCADGCGRGMGAEKCADGCGRRGCNGVAGNGWGEEAAGDQRAWLRGRLRTAWVRGSGWKWVEKKPLVMSELGCADSCGRQMDGKNCADGCGRRGCRDGSGEEAAGDERAWLRGRLRTANGWEDCADGCGRRGCQGVAGNGLGEEAAG